MTDAQGPFFQEGDTGKPTGATAVTAFAYTQATMFADIVRRLQNQHRSALWYKGLNADLLDSKHAAYLTTAVNETDVDHPDLNDTDPAAPTGGLNVKWQVSATQNSDDQTPVSAYVPFSSLAVVTIVSTDYVVITDTSDSNNPKRGLVSDITALVTVPTAASTTEVLTGTDAAKFVTPDALAALWEQGGDLASAGTVLVPEGGYYHITGTTTITGIDLVTNKAGRKVWLKFTDSVEIAHNASTLILPTGANITTAAGDTACFISEGSDAVRCVAYQRADGSSLAGGGSGLTHQQVMARGVFGGPF